MEESLKQLVFGKSKLLIQKQGIFLKFCIVGTANTMISLLVYYFLIKLEMQYLFSSIIAYCAGLFNGYIFSSTFVFQQKRNVKRALKFIGVNVSSLLINLLILYFFVEVNGISKLIAQLYGMMFNVIYNFSLNKWWTFK